MSGFSINEKHPNQSPVLRSLIKLGYVYITPSEANHQQRKTLSNVLLENILERQLRKINRISYKSKLYEFSDEHIHAAIDKLHRISHDGIINTNQAIYDLITLPQSLTQIIEGNMHSSDLFYIDWKNWQNNAFHCTTGYAVEKCRSTETTQLDIVLFVNGIPLAMIACNSADEDISKAISKQLCYQNQKCLPHLYAFGQLLIATNTTQYKYATVGTPEKHWVGCKEQINREQDPLLFSLCRPERLVDLSYRFIIFDELGKKIALDHQFLVIQSALKRIKQYTPDGRREGGIIWQTQRTETPLTMILLARSLALDSELTNPRIILVTDLDDLTLQLQNTCLAYGREAQRATTGNHLRELIAAESWGIITVMNHKFEIALSNKNSINESSDIFVLVDVNQTANQSSFTARVRQMLPKACLIGFTEAPRTKKYKDSFQSFGKLIEPYYSYKQTDQDTENENQQECSKLKKNLSYKEKTVRQKKKNAPRALTGNIEALSYYEKAKELIAEDTHDLMACEEASVYIAEVTQESLRNHEKINFWQDIDAQNNVKNEIDDILFEKIRNDLRFKLSEKQMQDLINDLMKVAKKHKPLISE